MVNNSNSLSQHIQREIDMLSLNAKAGSCSKESSVKVQASQVESQECYDRIFEEKLEVVHMYKTKADQALQMEQELMAKDKELASEKENNSKLKRIINRQKGLFRSINSLVAVPMRFLTNSLSQMIKETVLEEPSSI
uniref:Uncharacterized protein n=1 Tax=Ditylenchus dipsaci TaxID=166011 RepID=A0A915CLE8_9BILA